MNASSDLVRSLRRALDGTHPLVLIETDDELAVRNALFEAVPEGTPYRRWSTTRGLSEARFVGDPVKDTDHPAAALAVLAASQDSQRSVTVFYELAAHLSEPRTRRALREAVQWAHGSFSAIVLVERSADLPDGLESECHRIEVAPPDEAELADIVKETVRSISRSRKIEASIRRSTLEAIAGTLRGLTRRQATRVVTAAVVEDDRFDDADLERVMLHKRNACDDLGGVLELVQAPTSMDEIGGLAKLKSWLAARDLRSAREAHEFGLSAPRGVLLLGVQGAGKSLASKAVATAWRVPLLRLDAGSLFDRYVGESERRLRDSLAQADRMAPAVLWIDEIEKGFASASSQSTDGGLSRRMFGTLLTWMQERQSPTFLVATANDVSALPPEFLRKGRFDEIFFVDLPDASVREKILAIHLRKRRRDPGRFDLAKVAAETEGFSGAELEAGVESALRVAFADGRRDLTTEDLLANYAGSPPLSVVMADRVAELREWAAPRCVSAD